MTINLPKSDISEMSNKLILAIGYAEIINKEIKANNSPSVVKKWEFIKQSCSEALHMLGKYQYEGKSNDSAEVKGNM
jgi:hypothetical protein